VSTTRDNKLYFDFVIHILFMGVFLAIIFMQVNVHKLDTNTCVHQPTQRDVNATNIMNSAVLNSLVENQINNVLQPFPTTFLNVGARVCARVILLELTGFCW
jgi:hypothetical protein